MQSSCFLANSRLRMTTTSFLTAASVMRCLCCCAPLSWVGAAHSGELGLFAFRPLIPARRDSVELVEANSTASTNSTVSTNSTENPATGLITHRHAPHSTHPYWHVLVLLRRCCDGVADGATAVTSTGAHDATSNQSHHVG